MEIIDLVFTFIIDGFGAYLLAFAMTWIFLDVFVYTVSKP